MEKMTVTMTRLGQITDQGEEKGDSFLSVVAVGYDEQNAFDEALKALKYSCCRDFTRPTSCERGRFSTSFSCSAYCLAPGEDPDAIEEDVELFTYDGRTFAVPFDAINDEMNAHTLFSSEIKSSGQWPESF